MAEILANRIPTQEEYIGLTPVVAIVPWFLAGSLFPITAMPVGLAWVARFLPTTHVLALIRYGLLDRQAAGLHAIWGVSGNTAAATLSLLVILAWATAFTALSLRVFRKASVS
jgi:ABC-type polysaccharide/polyol phosphate export permease